MVVVLIIPIFYVFSKQIKQNNKLKRYIFFIYYLATIINKPSIKWYSCKVILQIFCDMMILIIKYKNNKIKYIFNLININF